MSFLAGRLAGTEGAFFAQRSKIAAARLREKLGDADFPSTSAAQKIGNNSESKADVLPEILSHSMPPYTYSGQDVSASSSLSMHASLSSVPSLSTRGKIGGGSDHLGGYHDPNVMNPLNAWVSLPRATFGPKRWTLPSKESSFQASTANELRQELNDSVDTEKMKAAMEDFSTNSRFLHTITSYLACIPIWSQMLTTGVAPDDNEKTPCPRMNQKTFVPSDIISSTEFLNSTSTSYHFLLYPDSTPYGEL